MASAEVPCIPGHPQVRVIYAMWPWETLLKFHMPSNQKWQWEIPSQATGKIIRIVPENGKTIFHTLL